MDIAWEFVRCSRSRLTERFNIFFWPLFKLFFVLDSGLKGPKLLIFHDNYLLGVDLVANALLIVC